MTELLEIALKEYGVKEIPGPISNDRILHYAQEVGMSHIDDEEISWCSVFVNWCAFKTGYPYTGLANARSWLTVGELVVAPELGDIVIFWRESESSWKGHVGIYISQNDNYIFVLGGNQNNRVQISEYPRSRLLGYRRLHKF